MSYSSQSGVIVPEIGNNLQGKHAQAQKCLTHFTTETD